MGIYPGSVCMQCVAQATPMIAVSFGVLRRDALKEQARAGLSLTRLPLVAAWAAKSTPEPRTRQERDAQRMARRLRPEARSSTGPS